MKHKVQRALPLRSEAADTAHAACRAGNMSSSSDDIPIEDIAARARAAPSPARSESPVPDWISQYHSPAAAKPSPQRFSVDSDDLEIIGSKPANASQEAVAEAHAAEPAQASQKASPKAKLTSAKAGRSKQKAAVPTVAMTLQKSGVQSTAAAAAPDSAALQNTTDAGAGALPCLPVPLALRPSSMGKHTASWTFQLALVACKVHYAFHASQTVAQRCSATGRDSCHAA